MGFVVGLAAIWTGGAAAQSLADAANRASESSADSKGKSRTFTDRDLKASSSTDDGLISTSDADNRELAPPGPVLTREEIVRRVMPSVVTIQAGNATGTGFFVERGLVMTNHHVVGNAGIVVVHLSDGTSTNGKVSRLAADADLALVSVDNAGPTMVPVALGSYRQLQTGEEVVAVGASLGVLRNTVTRGIVSAVRRTGGVVYVQTDAAINPGNSGGPLVDKYGRVIGVNTSKVMGAESLGFSIAIDHGRRLVNGQTYVADRAAPDATRSDDGSSAFTTPRTSDSEQRHQAGLAQYDAAVAVLSNQADYLDAQWAEYVRWCGIDASRAASGGRGWFDVWSGSGAGGGNARPDCSSARHGILERANGVRAGMTEASERARRAGVFPGEMRELRRRYALDYDGW